jgi:hypothetical protein
VTRTPRRREWKRWHFFAIAVAAIAIIGGVWSVLDSGGAPAGPSSPTPSVTSAG